MINLAELLQLLIECLLVIVILQLFAATDEVRLVLALLLTVEDVLVEVLLLSEEDVDASGDFFGFLVVAFCALFFSDVGDLGISASTLLLDFDPNVVHEQCTTILSHFLDHCHVWCTIGPVAKVLQASWFDFRFGGRGEGLARARTV